MTYLDNVSQITKRVGEFLNAYEEAPLGSSDAAIKLANAMVVIGHHSPTNGYDIIRQLVVRSILKSDTAYSPEVLLRVANSASGEAFSRPAMDLLFNIIPIVSGGIVKQPSEIGDPKSLLTNSGIYEFLSQIAHSAEIKALRDLSEPSIQYGSALITDTRSDSESTDILLGDAINHVTLFAANLQILNCLSDGRVDDTALSYTTVEVESYGNKIILGKSTKIDRLALKRFVFLGYTDAISADSRGRIINLFTDGRGTKLSFYRIPKSTDWVLVGIHPGD